MATPLVTTELTLEPEVLSGYASWPLARTASGLTYVDLTDEFTAWLGFANAGMLNKGNLLCFDYALSHLPRAGAIVEIGAFCGLSTNLINYYRDRHGVTNRFFNCDHWVFEGAGGTVGATAISHEEYRKFVMDTYRRNVEMFSGHDRPYTVDRLSDGFFDAWSRREIVMDVFDREVTLGGPIGFCYIDGDHTAEQARRDFENVDRFLERGGFILFDDSADGSKWDVVRVIEEIKRMPSYRVVVRNPNYLVQKVG